MKRLLILSVMANLVLLGLVWSKPLRVTEPARTLRLETRTVARQTRTAISRPMASAAPVSTWSRIESRELRTLIANLRAVGCPESTIRDIAILRVCRARRSLLLDLQRELALKVVTNPYLDSVEVRKIKSRQREIRDQTASELEAVLGLDWGGLMSGLLGFPVTPDPFTASLSVEKRAQLREIDRRFRDALDEVEGKRPEQMQTDDTAAYRALLRQKLAATAASLSPQEMDEYLMRNSHAAAYVRLNLLEAKSEQEYRTMVKLALQMDMSVVLDGRMLPGMPAAEEVEREVDLERHQRQEEFNRRLQELLGADQRR